jgi:hypothetical protein
MMNRADAAQMLLRRQAKLDLEIAFLREALKPFARNVDAPSLDEALEHITREDLKRAKEMLSGKLA